MAFDTARRKTVDVLFLKERHGDERSEPDWDREWEGQVVLSHISTARGRVGLLFPGSFTPTSVEVEQVVKGRCLLVGTHFEELTLVFINIYASINGAERKSFLDKVSSTLKCCVRRIFQSWVGDFNCTECEFLDRNHAEAHPGSQHALKRLVHSQGLVEVRRRIPAECRPTHDPA